MADHQLGRGAEARAELEQGRAIVEKKSRVRQDRGTPVQGFWFDWAFARILLRESATLIETSAPAPVGAGPRAANSAKIKWGAWRVWTAVGAYGG